MSEIRLSEIDLSTLVDEWLDWDQAAALLDVKPARVRTMVREHQLAAAAAEPDGPLRVPAALIMDGYPVKGVPGLLTVLHDNDFTDHEAIAWIFSDADLPGRPIDALRENRGSEVKRRAQALGY